MTDQLSTDAHPSPVDPPTKGIILFLHGFCSAAKTWKDMQQLLDADPLVMERYDYNNYSYTTKLFEWNPFARISDLKDLGQDLAAELALPKYRGRSVTLVGHSQGGLINSELFRRPRER